MGKTPSVKDTLLNVMEDSAEGETLTEVTRFPKGKRPANDDPKRKPSKDSRQKCGEETLGRRSKLLDKIKKNSNEGEALRRAAQARSARPQRYSSSGARTSGDDGQSDLEGRSSKVGPARRAEPHGTQ